MKGEQLQGTWPTGRLLGYIPMSLAVCQHVPVLALVPPAYYILPCIALLMVRQLPVERTEETFSELKAPRHQRLNRQKKQLRENLFGLCSQEPKFKKKKNYLELTQSSENKAVSSTESLQSYRAYMNCNFQRFLTQPSLDRCLQEHWKLLASVPSPCQIAVQNKVTVKYIQWFWYKLHMQNKRKHLIYN